MLGLLIYKLEKIIKDEINVKVINKVLFWIFFSVFISCSNSDFYNYEKGTLVLSLSPSINRVIVPEKDMDINSYSISCMVPNNSSFLIDHITGSTLVKEDLKEGDWIINATAHNSESEVVGEGTTTVNISQFNITEASITIEPVSGTGDLNVTVNLLLDNIDDPIISGVLIAEHDLNTYLSDSDFTDKNELLVSLT